MLAHPPRNVPALRGDPSSGAEKARQFLWAIALKEQKEAKVVVWCVGFFFVGWVLFFLSLRKIDQQETH